MPRLAVVDTNVLVSGLLKRNTPSSAVVGDIRNGALVPVVCRQIIDEYAAVLTRPKLGLPRHDVDEFLELISSLSQWAHVPECPAGLNLPAPEDWPFIASALLAACPMITDKSPMAEQFVERICVALTGSQSGLIHPARPQLVTTLSPQRSQSCI